MHIVTDIDVIYKNNSTKGRMSKQSYKGVIFLQLTESSINIKQILTTYYVSGKPQSNKNLAKNY